MHIKRTLGQAGLSFLLATTTVAYAQVTKVDFERAAGVGDKYRSLLENVAEAPVWVEGEDTLVYTRNNLGGHDFIAVDAATGTKQPAFDQARIADALTKVDGETYKPGDLPLRRLHLMPKRAAIEFSLGSMYGDHWHCDLRSYTCNKTQEKSEPGDDGSERESKMPWAANSLKEERASPDGKLVARVENYNIVVQGKDGKNRTILSTDGSEDNYYSLDSIAWSPDGLRLVAYRIHPGYERRVTYVNSSPPTQLQPMYFSIPYAKPGDVLDFQQPVLFDVAARHEMPVTSDTFPNPFDLGPAHWWNDSRGFTFDYNQRGHQVFRVIAVDGKTGAAHALISEESRTFVDYRPLESSPTDTGKIYRHDIADGKEILWASERDGWEHLYLLNGSTGEVKNQVTKGNWVVRGVDFVDDDHRQIYFEASGVTPGEDPYFTHEYRVNFDGSGMTALTPETGSHHVVVSSDGKYYADLVSIVDKPPVLSLHESDGGKKLADLEHGSLDKLKAAGWRAPEPFMSKGRDGKTEIWGLIYKPANFNPARRYPVIEDIYAGPQGSFVPKTFTAKAEPLTELGFVVVQIDGMGTNNRSKAFHDVAWKNLKDAGFADRILWHKAAAAKFPWYDISNVGIFGTSAGGQSAMGALLFHPEFYKVAVSNSGCHDNRMDKIWWNEQWMSWPIGPQYSESSNVDNAWRLQGKLMLVVGELDDNVDPASTFQVADRLEKANKYFDLLYVPGGHHGAGGAYGEGKLEDFFVRNILHQDTPAWNATPAQSSPSWGN